MDGLKPKLAVIMIGTNNSGRAKKIPLRKLARASKRLSKRCMRNRRTTKILLLAIFPRGDMSESKREATLAQREKNAKASEIASKLADDKTIFYLDIGKHFMEADGTIPQDDYARLVASQRQRLRNLGRGN